MSRYSPYAIITRQDIDDLVEYAEKNPEFKAYLQELDLLARKQNVELKDLVKKAVEWYYNL